jgi:hypothetical protein
MMKPYMQRLAELHLLYRAVPVRDIPYGTRLEMNQCLDLLAGDVWEEAMKFNLGTMAVEMNDVEWQNQLRGNE